MLRLLLHPRCPRTLAFDICHNESHSVRPTTQVVQARYSPETSCQKHFQGLGLPPAILALIVHVVCPQRGCGKRPFPFVALQHSGGLQMRPLTTGTPKERERQKDFLPDTNPIGKKERKPWAIQGQGSEAHSEGRARGEPMRARPGHAGHAKMTSASLPGAASARE